MTMATERSTAKARWIAVVALGLGLVVLAIAFLYPTYLRQQQIEQLRARGTTTEARIDYCATASINRPSAVTITCPGTFDVAGQSITEDILGLSGPLQSGDKVAVIFDPDNRRNVYAASAVRDGEGTGWLTSKSFVALVALVLVALLIWRQVIVLRSTRRT
jgi:hypothetical protein